MNSKVGLAILTIVVAVVAILAVVVVAGGIGIGDDKKVTVMGNVGYNMITGWSISMDDYLVESDSFFAVLWYMPWDTKDILVVAELSGGGNKYKGEGWAGKLNVIAGSAGYSVEIRHVPTGSYSGKLYLYEVEKGIIGEKNRVLQATKTFQVSV